MKKDKVCKTLAEIAKYLVASCVIIFLLLLVHSEDVSFVKVILAILLSWICVIIVDMLREK